MCEYKMLIFAMHISEEEVGPLCQNYRAVQCTLRRVAAASLISLMAWVFNWTILYDNEKKIIQIGFGQKDDF